MKRRQNWVLAALTVSLLLIVVFVPSGRAQAVRISRSALLLPSKLLSLSPRVLGSAMLRSGVKPAAEQAGNGVITGTSYHNDTSPPLRDIPPAPVNLGPEREANENPKIPHHHVDAPDGVVQNFHASEPSAMPGTILNFDGIPFPGVGCNCAPPDTNGEVGTTQYVQIVNEGYQVFNKTTGASVFGPVGIATIWTGFTGVCEFNGHGDPVVLFDQLANRWVITQFAGVSVPTDECIAVSTTDNATLAFNRYGFHLGSNFFDYPHLGVWPDAYYMSMNVFNTAGTAFLGPQPFAFDRAAMLAGAAATFVSTGITNGPTEETYLPSDLDGLTPPPAGAPNTFVEWPNGGVYKVFHFHADFAVPANSTFTLFASPPAAAFTVLCPATRACVPQLAPQTNLDAIADRFMFRLAYRNFGDHEAVVTNYTVSSGGVAGIRWIELRGVTAGPVTVFQESTYQPDTTWRWMGSVAQDHNGNMALGFSASDATINPQIRYAGRLAGDPVNTLAQGEAHLFDGTGSQSGTGSRWGDYSDITVDPVDDCTFWYTQEYYAVNATFSWRTRIGNFKFPGCAIGTPTPTITGTRTATPTSTNTFTPTNTPTATPTPCPGDQYTIAGGTATIVPGTTDIGSHCDDCDTLVALPAGFSFQLYNQTFSSVNVSSNGRLDFVIANEPGGFVTSCLPAPPNIGSYDYTIFPLWHDQRTDIGLTGCATFANGCGIFTSVSGSSPNRIFNIEWQTVRFNDNSQAEHYEVRLYEGSPTKQFDVIYGTLNGITAQDTAGVQGTASLGFFTQDFCNTAAPSNVSRTYTSAGCVTPTVTITGTRTATPTPSITPTASPTACANAWVVVTPMPLDLYGASATSDGVFAYAAGGYSFSTGNTLNVFNRYDPVANTWTPRTPMPDAVIMASAVYSPINNKIFVFGGEDAVSGVNSNATRIYDPVLNTWSAGANMPDVRSFMASGYNTANNRIYLISGYNTGQVTSAQPQVWEYDPVANTFNTSRLNIPHATGGPAFGIINGHFYVAGGRDALNTVINLTWDYNIAANTWTARANMPTAENVPGTAVANGLLWAFGFGNPFGPSTRSAISEAPVPKTANTGVKYDPVSDSWSSAPNLNVARSFVAGTLAGTKLVAAGGYNGATTVTTTEVLGVICATPTPTNTPTGANTGTNTPTSTRTFTPSITPTPTPTACVVSTTPVNEGFESGLGSFVSTVPTCVPGGCGWSAVTTDKHSGAQSAFAPDRPNISDQLLTLSSGFAVPSNATSAVLSFWHRVALETNFDGGVLEFSTDNGATWSTSVPAFITGGYNGTISTSFGSPIGGRQAWTGNIGSVGNFVNVRVNLISFAGQSNLRFRFREANDNSVAITGWWVDDVLVTILTPCPTPTPTPTPASQLTDLSPAKMWVGLANSDDVGLRLDLLAEVFINATKIGQGEIDNAASGSSGFNNAILQTIPLSCTGCPVPAPPGSQLKIRVSARRTCFDGGHTSGTPRLWYNGQPIDVGVNRDAGSRFDATIGGSTDDYFLRLAFALEKTPGAARTPIDVSVNSASACPARPFTSWGTWVRTLP